MCRLNRENGQTFVVVTHDPKVGKRASRRIWMESGRVVREDTGIAS
jgi:putative ABC transport system ATP-binding protein